ncbi:MAG: hypothetical protein ACRDSH_12360 [Pseudonocardiaceae bacterium]
MDMLKFPRLGGLQISVRCWWTAMASDQPNRCETGHQLPTGELAQQQDRDPLEQVGDHPADRETAGWSPSGEHDEGEADGRVVGDTEKDASRLTLSAPLAVTAVVMTAS